MGKGGQDSSNVQWVGMVCCLDTVISEKKSFNSSHDGTGSIGRGGILENGFEGIINNLGTLLGKSSYMTEIDLAQVGRLLGIYQIQDGLAKVEGLLLFLANDLLP